MSAVIGNSYDRNAWLYKLPELAPAYMYVKIICMHFVPQGISSLLH